MTTDPRTRVYPHLTPTLSAPKKGAERGIGAVLRTPHPEQVATTSLWAFVQWLRATGRADLDGWPAVVAWSANDRSAFTGAIAYFAGVDAEPRLIRAAAEVLLHADIRPDDVVLVATGTAWPWRIAAVQGTKIVLADAPRPADLFPSAADARASVLIADATTLANAAFQRPGRRPDLSALRSIIATGGPLAPAARIRLYTWVKADLLLLARAGDSLWGSPLEPVRTDPGAPLSLFRPPSVRAPG